MQYSENTFCATRFAVVLLLLLVQFDLAQAVLSVMLYMLNNALGKALAKEPGWCSRSGVGLRPRRTRFKPPFCHEAQLWASHDLSASPTSQGEDNRREGTVYPELLGGKVVLKCEK